MHCVTRCARIPQPKPNTFAGLMEMYEHNYIKLRKLCGDINKLPEYRCSQADNALDLYIEVVERTKYTTTLNLTYKFSQKTNNKSRFLPNLYIKVYFDAMQAEVLHREVRNPSHQRRSIKQLGNKWRDNRFLFKWLSFCIAQGHSFKSENYRASPL